MFACTAFHRLSARLGVPALLAFMFFGDAVRFGRAFEGRVLKIRLCRPGQHRGAAVHHVLRRVRHKLARGAPAAAPAIVLSSLGTHPDRRADRAVLPPGAGHAAAGGAFVRRVLGSTDAASVFSILRARKLALKENTDSLLEVESGSNDPFAYMLTAVLLTAMESGITPGSVARAAGRAAAVRAGVRVWRGRGGTVAAAAAAHRRFGV